MCHINKSNKKLNKILEKYLVKFNEIVCKMAELKPNVEQLQMGIKNK